MAKYTLAGLLAVALTASVGFFLVSKANKRDAAAGPAPVQLISVRHEGIFPREFEVRPGQPVEIQLENRVDRYHLLDIFSADVEQLIPVQRGFNLEEGAPVPQFHLEARGGETHSTVVRFNKAGEYEMRLTAAGLPDELEIITVIVK